MASPGSLIGNPPPRWGAPGDDLAVFEVDSASADSMANRSADESLARERQSNVSYAGDISPQQAWDLLSEHPDAVLVDVRTDAEWRFVGVPDTSSIGRPTMMIEWVTYPTGARNDDFVAELRGALAHSCDPGAVRAEPDKRPVVFICRSGQRSIDAAKAATAAGIGPSYNVLEGFEGALDEDGHRGAAGWRALGLPWRQS